jgi:hypothetical protein
MKKILRSTLRSALGAAVGAIGLAACDSTAPPSTSVSATAEPEAISEGETLSDVVREALAEVTRDPDAFSRARRLGALLPTLGPELVPAVKQTLEDPTLDFGAPEYELLLRYWARHQPEDACRWAADKSPAFFRIGNVLSTFTLWAEADPKAAASAAQRWAEQRPDLRAVLPKALVRGWFAANPSELAQFIHDLGMGMPQQRALSTYMRVATQKQGYDAVMRWAESLPDDDEGYKTAVYRQVASVVPVFDLEAGLRWCEAHCDGPHGKDLRGIIARRWMRHDAAGALAWLSNAPLEGHDKNFAVRITFEDWAQEDREAALAWMAAQTIGEPESWLQPIFPVYARLLSADSPADAIVWAERVEEGPVRRFSLIEVARAWRQVDEAATEAWLLQSPLSEEDREHVRAPKWDRR